MSFSLRTLLAVVLVAAIFAATILYLSLLSTVIAVNLTLIYLFVGTLGVWVGRFDRTYWIPACFVGWVYFLISSNTIILENLGDFTPSVYVADAIWNHRFPTETRSSQTIVSSVPMIDSDLSVDEQHLLFVHIMNCIFTLVFSTLAGVIASVPLRHKSEPRSE